MQNDTPITHEMDIKKRLEEIKKLNRGRFDYVMARAERPQPTVEEACASFGRTRNWFYQMAQDEREELDRLADEVHKDKVLHAFLILEEHADMAANVKAEGLKSRDQRIRQSAATEILDRTIGKPGENVKHSGSVTFVWQPHKPNSTGES